MEKLQWEIVESNEDGKFSCLECKDTFSSIHIAKSHFKQEHIESKFTCEICKKSFSLEDYFNLHMQSHMLPKTVIDGGTEKIEWKLVKPNEDGKISCHDCSETFLSMWNAINHHKNLHTKENKYICKVCDKSFTVKDYLKLHIYEAHTLPKTIDNASGNNLEWKIVTPNENDRITCLDCTGTFTNMNSAREHHKLVHMLENNYVCEVCDKKFRVEDYLRLHVQSVHMLPKIVNNGLTKKLEWKIVQPNEDGKFNCLECEQIFSSISNARIHHKDLHMRQNKHICKVCSKSYEFEDYLVGHTLSSHMLPKIIDENVTKTLEWKKVEPNSDGRIKCLDCEKTFPSMHSVRVHHKEIHMKEKKYVCEVCNRSFHYEDYLLLHIRSDHMLPKKITDNLQEKCEWKIVKPNEDGKVNCLECSKSFSSIHTARTHHKEAHLTKNKFTCTVCTKQFDYEDLMKVHMQAAHLLPKKITEGTVEKYEWKLAEPNQDEKINCFECSKTFDSFHTAKIHHEKAHKNGFICQVCDKCFEFEDHMNLHIQAVHMLPQTVVNGTEEKVEWKIVEPNENGRYNCFDCTKDFQSMHSAKVHHERAHKSTKRFICEICQKWFEFEDYLNLHIRAAHMLPMKVGDGSVEKFEWKKVKPDENEKVKCFDCSKTFDSIYSAKIHYKRVHENENKYICKICKKHFEFKDSMRLHVKAAHMLPIKGKNGSSEKFKWKIVEPDENGKINCLDCSKSFSCMSTAKVHQYKCLQQTSQEAFLSPKKRPG